MVCIERCGAGDYKVVTPRGTTTGPTLEEALVVAMSRAGVGDEDFIHTLAGSFLWAEAIQTLMGDGNTVQDTRLFEYLEAHPLIQPLDYEESAPCTCTISCIPQGITEEQRCRQQYDGPPENEEKALEPTFKGKYQPEDFGDFLEERSHSDADDDVDVLT